MDPFTWGAIMLGMQAAGMIFDYAGMEDQKKANRYQQFLNKQALQLEEAGINANIEMTRLQTEDASLAAMQNLRKTLGSQAAYFAATGGRGNAAFGQQAISATGQDERTRRLNLMGKEAELNAQKQFAKLGFEAKKNNINQQNQALDNQFINRIFNLIPGPTAIGNLFSGGNRANSARANYSRPSVSSNFGFRPYTG